MVTAACVANLSECGIFDAYKEEPTRFGWLDTGGRDFNSSISHVDFEALLLLQVFHQVPSEND